MRKPDLTVKVYLVPHGYQVDFFDIDGHPRGSTCRDFTGSKTIKYWTDQVELYFVQALERLRHAQKGGEHEFDF